MGVADELELVGGIEEEWGMVEGELEIGDETLDLASTVDLWLLTSLKSNLIESFATTISGFVGTWGCLINPYNTSAISISISSWAEEVNLVQDFGSLCLGPLGFYNGKT